MKKQYTFGAYRPRSQGEKRTRRPNPIRRGGKLSGDVGWKMATEVVNSSIRRGMTLGDVMREALEYYFKNNPEPEGDFDFGQES